VSSGPRSASSQLERGRIVGYQQKRELLQTYREKEGRAFLSSSFPKHLLGKKDSNQLGIFCLTLFVGQTGVIVGKVGRGVSVARDTQLRALVQGKELDLMTFYKNIFFPNLNCVFPYFFFSN
jgi:hypothetical protein